MPLRNERLVIDPTYPMAKELAAMCGSPDEVVVADGTKVRNRWYCRRWGCEVIVAQEPDGRIWVGKLPAFHHVGYDLHTLGCADAWGFEQESNALELLQSLVSYRQFKQYMLTGMFLESSARSRLTYMFRRLKPTVAIDARAGDESQSRILCTLCLHPIAYYQDSWAGAMCPTDDVIAHLMLMRGDEVMFWRRSNQHPPYRPEAGL